VPAKNTRNSQNRKRNNLEDESRLQEAVAGMQAALSHAIWEKAGSY